MLLHSRNKEKQALLEFLRTYDLTQLVTEAARVTETIGTLLDVILVNTDHHFTDSRRSLSRLLCSKGGSNKGYA